MSQTKAHRATLCCLLAALLFAFAWAGTTGKIAGRVVDKNSGAPIPGANILVDGTTLGAAADLQGYYTILNVPPGIYRLKANMMGYGAVAVREVRVEIDRTATVDLALQEEALVGEEITVLPNGRSCR